MGFSYRDARVTTFYTYPELNPGQVGPIVGEAPLWSGQTVRFLTIAKSSTDRPGTLPPRVLQGLCEDHRGSYLSRVAAPRRASCKHYPLIMPNNRYTSPAP
jgi:hypothetical protein